MAFIPAADCIHVTMDYFSGVFSASNGFYVFDSLPASPSHQSDLIEVFRNWWDVTGREHISSDWALRSIKARDMGSADSLETILNLDTPLAGTIVEESCAANVAMTVTLQTVHIGKSRRGRIYVVGIPEVNSAVGTFKAGVADDIASDYTTLHDDIIAVSDAWVVASFFSGGAPRTTALLTDVEEVRANSKINSQRRRTNPA